MGEIKYRIPFYGRFYRAWSKFIHKRGYHYAPKKYPPEPHEVKRGLGGTIVTEWYHWCTWCGLRGTTIDVSPPTHTKLPQSSSKGDKPKKLKKTDWSKVKIQPVNTEGRPFYTELRGWHKVSTQDSNKPGEDK